ncbi:hypothetical protein ACIQWR_10410 [Streptomyces sp. NPDC098789]|uniref:hypothetical protein n=1 Tax=Streptomyces sp. NPDC098789 TaxID=3366098 RepID=UPI003803C4E0
MFTSTVRGAAIVVTALAALTVSCGPGPQRAEPAAPTTSGSAAATGATSPAASPATGAPAEPTTGGSPPAGAPAPSAGAADPAAAPPVKVRDAFAGLQATLGDSCTPSGCAYFLGRVYDELHTMDRAMKTDPKGPGHFPEPIALIAKLDGELAGDRSFDNLKEHQTLLIGTRDKVNTWMQGHPDDYR